MACLINFAILFLLIPVLIIFLYFRRRFIISSRELKRLEGISRSPIFVHANNTLIGITTIRAANKQDILQKEFYTYLNGFTQAYFALCSLNRWFGIRLDLVLLAYTLLLVYSCIVLKNFLEINSGLVGLLLIYNIQLSALFQWTVRQSAEVENLMTSVERIIEYSTIENEEKNMRPKKLELDWPRTGSIEFRNVSYAYDTNLPFVLKNLNLSINSGEKVGIIGRTGKSNCITN
jgi:ATP-binding cassette, subfamily C (CFTR/MRP), member 4